MKVVIELANGNWFTLYYVSKIAPDGDIVEFYQGDRGEVIARIKTTDIIDWTVFQGINA